VAERLQLASKPLRTRARFHADQGRRRIGKEVEDRGPAELGALHWLAVLIEPCHMKDVLADVDAVDGGTARLIAHDDPPLNGTPVCRLRGRGGPSH